MYGVSGSELDVRIVEESALVAEYLILRYLIEPVKSELCSKDVISMWREAEEEDEDEDEEDAKEVGEGHRM